MLSIHNFSKSYSGQKIVAADELLIPEGIHWVKGVNGSGKSTFFRAIAGIVPFEGDISWKGVDQKKDPVNYRMKINMGEAEPLYPDFLSGFDILKFISEAKGGGKEQLKELGDLFQVASFWKNPAGTYSSGMLKKISIIAAFLGNPELIILDEPLITIDVASVKIVYELVRDTHENQGISFLLSSHQDFTFESLPIQHFYQVENQRIQRI